MSKLIFDEVNNRKYETGCKYGILWTLSDEGTYNDGVAFDGLTSVDDSPSGDEPTDLWADDMKWLTIRSAPDFTFTISAYMYPPEWSECDGSKEVAPGVFAGQQTRRPFAFCYRSVVGNEVKDNDYGYKYHIYYGASCSPSQRQYGTVNNSPNAITFSWQCTTTPIEIAGMKPTAVITIDSTLADAAKLRTFEDIIFGSENSNSRLPMPDEIIRHFSAS